MEASPRRNVFSNPSIALMLVIAYIGFISLGLPDTVAGVAWPSVRETFARSQSDFGLVFLALGCGYCASGFWGGTLTRALGLGNLLWISSGLVAVAMFGSGLAPNWLVFVVCGVIWGLGSGGIDAGLNAYVSRHFSARHVNWLHACYSLGATTGPLLMTAMLVQLGSWSLGYGLVGLMLSIMTLLFRLTRAGWNDPQAAAVAASNEVPTHMQDVLRRPLVWLQVLLFFLYVGLEFVVGQWSFTVFTESRGVATDRAGMLAGAYYGAIGVGRVVAGAAAHRVGLDRMVRFSLLLAVSGAVLLAFATDSRLSEVGLVIVGLGLAPVFPCLMARTPARLGAAHAAHAVGFQVSAGMLGAALMPGVAGLVAESFSLEAVTRLAVVMAALLLATHEVLVWSGKGEG